MGLNSYAVPHKPWWLWQHCGHLDTFSYQRLSSAVLGFRKRILRSVLHGCIDEETDEPERQEPSSSTALKRKKISKKQQLQADLSERILQIAEKEEDQVDL